VNTKSAITFFFILIKSVDLIVIFDLAVLFPIVGHRSERRSYWEALRNEQLARSMIESTLRSNADVISQLSSCLRRADDQLNEERQVVAILASKVHSTEQVALQYSHESTSQRDILCKKYV